MAAVPIPPRSHNTYAIANFPVHRNAKSRAGLTRRHYAKYINHKTTFVKTRPSKSPFLRTGTDSCTKSGKIQTWQKALQINRLQQHSITAQLLPGCKKGRLTPQQRPFRMPEQAFAEYEKARSEEGKILHRLRIICFITITHTIRTEQEQKSASGSARLRFHGNTLTYLF